MDNNYGVSCLLPFINENEISYYANLKTEKLTLLVSLAPFVNNSGFIMKLSKLDINHLQELTGELPRLNDEEIKAYINKVFYRNI